MSKADDLQQRVEAFSDLSIKFVQELPEHAIARRLGGQYLDCSTSVAANYRSALAESRMLISGPRLEPSLRRRTSPSIAAMIQYDNDAIDPQIEY